MHLDLIIARIGVHEAKELVSSRNFYWLIDPPEGITIFWTCFVEIRKVDADSPLSILFLHENEIKEPVWIERLSDEAILK